MPNRLAEERSPYLLQHRDNPVDWYPWGTEAFERARREDRPVFVSIGYAACHWCHVMAHECFEDSTIAALMNELFVNVKVDREERPDVDAVYMNAIQIMGQGGGWPLSAFCTPAGVPYYLGTYFPPTDSRGRPGFPRLLRMMSGFYSDQREKVVHNTEGILDGLHRMDEHFRKAAIGADVSRLDGGLLIAAGRRLAQRTDPHNGGFGSSPKFPSSSSHELLARVGRLSFGGPARAAFLLQCRRMADGGIYDQLGGGFARYSVDERWLVPHFEKMLYDNGQLLALQADAYAMSEPGDEMRVVARRVIGETLGWLDREMTDPAGGLYASQDADSEGEEGTYYVWTPAQIRAAIGRADAIQFEAAYGVTETGNFEHGATVLSRVTSLGGDSDETALRSLRQTLLSAREQRIPPETDTKVLSGWNGLVVSGLVRAWQATGEERALAKALEVATFLAEVMFDGERLARIYKDGHGCSELDGTLEDYAFVASAFLSLAEATDDVSWWQRGEALARIIVGRFYEEVDGVGVFFMVGSSSDSLLIHKPESNHDNAMPAGAAVAIELFLRIGTASDDTALWSIAEGYLSGRAPQAAEQPFASSRLLAALDLYLNGTSLVVTEGKGREELLAAAHRCYAPTLMIAGSWTAASLTADKSGEGGRARAYVCRGQSCAAPVADPESLVQLLAAPATASQQQD